MTNKFLINISNIFSNVNKFAGYFGAFLVVLMTVNVFVVVLLRYLFGISFYGVRPKIVQSDRQILAGHTLGNSQSLVFSPAL